MNEPSRVEFRGTSRFELRSRIGQGAVGVVYEAIDRERNMRVALKTLRTASPEHILSLKNEFRAVQDLQHPNLVRLGELFEDHGHWFFTMEYVEGQSLLQYVRAPRARVVRALDARVDGPASDDDARGGVPYDETRLRSALAQLARGLLALHGAKKVHRDIKPSNVLVDAEGRVIILDFGVVSDLLRGARRGDEGLVGTMAYMAPEQAESETASPAADWYAVGVVLYQVLTGELPFRGTGEEMLEQKILGEPPPPHVLVPQVPRDLSELCIALMQRAPEARPTGRDVLARLRIDAGDETLDASGENVVFFGRRDELSLLDAAFEDARTHGAVSVVVHGESGVGKSHLVRTFGERLLATHPNAVLFTGRCYERESVPYKAVDGLIDDLVRYLRDLSPAEQDELLPDGTALLAQVFPVLEGVGGAARASGAAEIVNPHEQRQRVFAALRHVLARIATLRPLVLVVDDLQWADADSLALLTEVLRPPAAPSVLFLATRRVATEVRRLPLSELLAQEAVLPGDVRHVHVEQLPPSDAARLVSHLLGGKAANDADVQAITQETGGHPLFIDELIRQRSLQRVEASRFRLDDALHSRVMQLDAASRNLVEVISVAGVPIAQEVAANAAAVDLGQFFYLAAVLRAAHLVRTTGVQRADLVEPYHDRVRESVLAHLDPAAKKAWHGRLAIALERSGNADPEILAVHWQDAGNASRAADYAELAADQASRILAFDRAVRLVSLAIELRGRKEEDDGALRRKLAEALTNAGRFAEAADVRIALATHAPATEALDLRRMAAEQFLCSGHFDRGKVLLRAVLKEMGVRFPEAPLAVLFGLLVLRALLRVRGLGFRERAAASIEPLALVRVDAARSAGAGFSMSDNIRGAYFQTLCLLHALRAGDLHRIVHSLCMDVCFTSAGGTRTRARTAALLASAEVAAERLGTPAALAMAACGRGYAHYMIGEWKEARTWLMRSEEIFRDRCVAVGFELNSARAMLYRALGYLGALRELEARVPPVFREVRERGDIYTEVNFRTNSLALLGLAADDPERVEEELRHARGRLPPSAFLVQHYFCLAAEVQLDLYVGRAEHAAASVEGSWRALERSLLLRIQPIRIIAFEQRARCAIAAARGAPRERDARLASAERDAGRIARIGVPWGDAMASMVRAGIAQVRGDLTGAAVGFGDAARGFESVHMGLHAAVARRRQGELLGGDEGRELVVRSNEWMHGENVRDPAKMAAVLAPSVAP